jgi:hypothetical protein
MAEKTTCHHCGEVGHIRPNCPALEDADDKEPDVNKSDATSKDKKTEKKKKKTSFAQQAAETDNESEPESQFTNFGFCTATSNRINLREMMLLDNQSTVDLFCNRKLVSRVWRTEDSMTVHGNGGTLTTQYKAHIKNYGDVWFHSKALTNILSSKNVCNKYHVTYDSLGDGAFIVHKPNGVDVHFVMHADGLHYHDTKNRQFSMPMVSTAKEESEGFSKRQIEQAKTARDFQAKVGHPSTQDMKPIVKSNLIVNCPVTAEDIDRAEKIYGPSVPILKGKTTCQTPLSVASDYVAVPPEIMSANKYVTLSGDLFFINKVPFFQPSVITSSSLPRNTSPAASLLNLC